MERAGDIPDPANDLSDDGIAMDDENLPRENEVQRLIHGDVVNPAFVENGQRVLGPQFVHGDIRRVVRRRQFGADFANQEEVGSETTNNTEDEEQMDISDDQDASTDQAVPASSGIEEEEDDEDRYKPEGTVTLEIDRFSEFARGNPPDAQRLSQPVYIRGLPWKILAIPRDLNRSPLDRRSGSKALGFFLQCNADSPDTSWSCNATATLKILSKKQGVDDHTRRISHTFYSKENDWGYSQYAQCDTLLDPEGGYCANDTVTLQVHVSADAPHGVQWDSKKHAGYIGLKNQGATCYMNSILQTLFFTNKLRKVSRASNYLPYSNRFQAVYQMPTEEDDPDNSVALAMQRVFYELQFASTPVGTKKLTRSFGWDSVDSFLQHDVQELCRVLLDNLESKMKNTCVADTIPSLFKGRMKSYIKCTNVAFESSREESFYDVQLNVKGKPNIIESFRDYTQAEVLDGENKYDAGPHGLQPAEKGVKFLSFPPVLHLQLMRFQYDPALDANVKVNDRFEFPEELILDEFVDERGERDDYTYLLHAVLVHSGDFHGGHYVVFINTNLKGNQKWCKFDDDVVSRATVRDAVNANFGGDDPELMTRSYTNAYMLVYVKKNAISDVLAQVAETDIPEHLKTRFESEKKAATEQKKKREEESFFMEINVCTDNDMYRHAGFDLFDLKEFRREKGAKMRVQKTMTIADLYSFVAQNFEMEGRDFRLWQFHDINAKRESNIMRHPNYLESLRPHFFLKADAEDNERGQAQTVEVLENENLIYIELGQPDSAAGYRLMPYNEDSDLLYFLKFYNHERKLTEYKGTLVVGIDNTWATYLPEITRRLELPPDVHLNVYVETSPDTVQPHRNINRTIRESQEYIVDGGILIVEVADKVSSENNTQYYFNRMFNRIDVEAHVNMDGFGTSVNSPAPPVKGTIGLDWPMQKVVNWLGKEIDFNAEQLLLWKIAQHNEKPSLSLTRDQFNQFTVKELLSLNGSALHDPRLGRTYKLFYTKLPIPFLALESRQQLKVQALYDKFQTAELTLFPEKNGTVQSILDEAKRDFKFSETGTGELRLVHCGSGASCYRVFSVIKNDISMAELKAKYLQSAFSQLRVEEIPSDQKEVAKDEKLFPVAHYDKEPNRMHGIPFFLKIVDGEPIVHIRRRIRELLDVSEREFEKYKFTIVMNNRVVRELDNNDENAVVNFNELSAHTHFPTNPTNAPYLGIDHMNKSRGSRGTHTAEKPIIIHN
ncbi:Peptidase C19 [Aphelenchoides avenae]|nr:Peptidase C19 [Aphelenchus avenae]